MDTILVVVFFSVVSKPACVHWQRHLTCRVAGPVSGPGDACDGRSLEQGSETRDTEMWPQDRIAKQGDILFCSV